MPTPAKLLVAIDLSESSRTPLAYAAALAGRIGASLTALYVAQRHVPYDPFPAFPPEPSLDPERGRELEASVRRFVADAAGAQPVELLLRDGDPGDEIVAVAAEPGFDLVVVGTHGRRGFERWGLGSVTDRVARRVERPLLAVPPHARTEAARILCAVDLSDASPEVLEHAAGLAQRLGARLTVLHVAEGSHWYDPWPASGVDLVAVREAVAASAQERLAALVARSAPPELDVERRLVFGRPHREIERLAAEQADLVVLGIPAASGLDRLFFGSTAQHVLRSAACPVLLVRHRPGGAALA